MANEVPHTARGKVANEFLRTTPGERGSVRQVMPLKEQVTMHGGRASELHHIIRGEKGKGVHRIIHGEKAKDLQYQIIF